MAGIDEVAGIGEGYAKKLADAGITSAEALLEQGASPQGRKAIAGKTSISDALILRWVNLVDLLRINGVGREFADLLEAAGVDTILELAQRNPENLHQALVKASETQKGVGRLPTTEQVKGWVEAAKQLPRKITY